jgi:hypothetical protein
VGGPRCGGESSVVDDREQGLQLAKIHGACCHTATVVSIAQNDCCHQLQLFDRSKVDR